MWDFIFQYGLFLAKTLTLVIAIVTTIGCILILKMKNQNTDGTIGLEDMSEYYDSLEEELKSDILSKDEFKAYKKSLKEKIEKQDNEKKSKQKAPSSTNANNQEAVSDQRLFVLKFRGDIEASGISSLREEITAILLIAKAHDEVLVILESMGGYVHTYGHAASQLERIRSHGLTLTICVDEVAASGGYLMACVSHRLICAPFAIIGSIGVIGSLPNFNRLLKKHDIDYEQHTAGEFKRTLTVFGENTDEARIKFKADMEDVHHLFKNFITKYRPSLDLNVVATGETWHGVQALELGLVDALSTSDNYLLEKHRQDIKIYKLTYDVKEKLKDKIRGLFASGLESIHKFLTLKNAKL